MHKEYILLNGFRKAKKGFTAGFHVPLSIYITALCLNPLEPALHYCGANANYRCGRFSNIVAHGEAFTNSGRVFQPIRIGPAIFSGSQSRSFYCVSH